ncbi:LamG-like jellyroll fold domain-containing protein [Streptomyces polygonati]|uniref:LamG-like jellyroll fold domain-containing protein n=1 Tax=Streptomyces polygonati TaxID=1617087 RepID=A0ABV8HUD5_9ACTN
MLVALPATSASADAPAEGDPLTAAQHQAVASGQAVTVDSLTSEISTIQANPDGTFTSTTNLLPVRVRQDGTWVPVDATLAVNADGTLSPKATPNAVQLSGGGPGPLVTLTHADGTSMALTMPFALPAPAVSGDTAVYSAVLPGVDLSVSVTDQGGFSDVLIVHNADAAADPRLEALTLAASTQGLTLRANPSGGMDAVTSDGTLAYLSPRPLMWDSATPQVPVTSLARTTAVQPADTADPGANATMSSADGPGSAAHVADVPMTTDGGGVTLTPDASMLNDPGTQYPVFIDPYTNPIADHAGHYDEVYSSSACNDSPQYDKPQTNGEGVGYQQAGGACGSGIERSYYTIDTGDLHTGFQVYDSRITIATTYAASWDCSHNQPLTMHTTEAITSGTDWNNRPSPHDAAFPPVSTTVPSGANPNSSCSNHTATFVVTDQAQTLADYDGDGYNAAGDIKGAPNTWTFGLYGDESQTSGNDNYLRMSESLTLTTKYDMAPATPASPHTTPASVGASGPCVLTTDDGWIGSTTYSDAGSNIQLHSTVTTQISGEKAAAHYVVWDHAVLDSTGNSVTKSSPDTTYLANGTDASVPIGFTLLDGHEYGWDVYSQDDSALQLKSATSDHCWFKTDFSPPETPAVTTNPSFPPVGSGAADPVIYAAPGRTAAFTVTGADSPSSDTSCTERACLTSGIDHFIWKLDTPPTAASHTTANLVSTATNGTGSATLNVPVVNWGVHTLYVAGVDAAGNISTAPASYTFTVPWNPTTKITPGDITGDGVPDLLATTRTGDLDLVPGDSDPAQSPAPAQTGPLTGTPPAVTGPVTVSTKADSPDGTGWNNYLIAHRGNLHGADTDDLFAYNKNSTSQQLYVVKNDLDPISDTVFPLVPYSTFGGFIGKRFDVVPKSPCQPASVVSDASRCRTTDYNSSTWNITQLITPGNVFGNTDYPAVITVENKKLWIYQSDGGDHLTNPILLGDGDWTGQTLITPGTVQGTPVLWTRDNSSGTVYSFPINVDQTTLLPQLLHAPVHTALTSALAPAGGGTLCLDDEYSKTADYNKIQIYTCDNTAAQTWSYLNDGSLRVLGKCLDVSGSDVTNGTLVQLFTCNGTGAQVWTPGPTGSLINPESGKCLDDPGSSTTNGTQLEIYTCNNSSAQNWTSTATANWNTNPPAALAPVLPAALYPAVASPGDVNSAAGPADGNPDLYATDTNGQLAEYTGIAPSGATAQFALTPVSLGSVTDTATHWWNLAEGSGSTAADCATATDTGCTGGLNATLSGAYSRTNDATRGTVLNLTGTTGYAATSGPALDTSSSFSVSLWAKLSSTTANSTFLSQSGGAGYGNGFQLYYSAGLHTWAFGRHASDAAVTTFTAAYGNGAVAGRWTHLVGVYDAAAQQLSLYVDGRLAGTQAYTGTAWNATGPFQIGRRISQNAYGEYANGLISDIRTYPTALPPADASATGDTPAAVQLD